VATGSSEMLTFDGAHSRKLELWAIDHVTFPSWWLLLLQKNWCCILTFW